MSISSYYPNWRRLEATYPGRREVVYRDRIEASFDIGARLGVSFLEVLNSGNPPQVGVNYRLSDKLQLRGDTNLSDDNRIFLEYRVKF